MTDLKFYMLGDISLKCIATVLISDAKRRVLSNIIVDIVDFSNA